MDRRKRYFDKIVKTIKDANPPLSIWYCSTHKQYLDNEIKRFNFARTCA